MSAKKKLEDLRLAYEDVVREYAKYRRDRQEQMTRIRAALDDAYTGARTGNLMTPPWVIQSINDARADGGWTLPPGSSVRCPGCDLDPVGYAPHNGKGDCPPIHPNGDRDA